VGQFVEVRDTAGRWVPAEVKLVRKGPHVHIHYDGWSSRWDEWLEVCGKDRERVRTLGSAIEDDEELAERKRNDAMFRARLLESFGFLVVDMKGDGSCLFRAVAHQVFGDAERHAEVRKMCCDHMEQDGDYFRDYIGADLDDYVKHMRSPSVWGGHLEIFVLREVFNCNIEVYDSGSMLAPKPLGLFLSEHASIPTMRLSFHGGNHYNSLVDPRRPPPIGTGLDAPVNYRTKRLEEQKQDRPDAPAARLFAIASFNISALMRPTITNVQVLNETDFERVWARLDLNGTGYIPAIKLDQLVEMLLARLYQRIRDDREKSGGVIESLEKAYREMVDDVSAFADKLASDLAELPDVDTNRIPMKATQQVFLEKIQPLLSWELAK
jgi:hypothetical protein